MKIDKQASIVWGKGVLAELPDGRTVRVCASPKMNRFLLEFVSPAIGGVSRKKELGCHRKAKVRMRAGGKIVTAVTLSPEAFSSLLRAGVDLVNRLAEEE